MTELTPNAAMALAELIKDYKSATAVGVPGYTGGISRKIAEELIRMGWRKQPGPNLEPPLK